MEAELVDALPRDGDWQYEPKWDGFRGVLENDGGETALWSRKEISPVSVPARPRGGGEMAWLARGRRARRCHREAPRLAIPARFARGRAEGEAAQDGRLRDRRFPLERQGGRPHLDTAARRL